jgi:hypothetical protein
MNHIATGRASAPEENYSLLIMGDSNVDGDGGGVNGDGSGGNFPSRQGARTETSVPRNWSSMVAVLQNFSGRNTDRFRVFVSEALYRQRGDVREYQGVPHHRVAHPGGHHFLAPLRLFFGLRLVSGENRNFGLRFVQFREYILCNFSGTQK